MQAPLHLAELCCHSQLFQLRSRLSISKSTHLSSEVVYLSVLLLVLVRMLVLRLLRCFTCEGLLAFGLLYALASQVVGSCPCVVGEVVHR